MVNSWLKHDSENFLLQSISGDIDGFVSLASARALGIIEKLISGPFLKYVVEV